MEAKWQQIAVHVGEQTGSALEVLSIQPVGGGCINDAFMLNGREHRYFVKTHHLRGLEMFEAETEGLREIFDSNTIHVPKPIACGTAGDVAYLVMEALQLGGGNKASVEQLGYDLAAMHRVTQSQYGWHRDNTIGSTPQINTYSEDWAAFWAEHRLGFQLQLAAQKGAGARLQRQGEQLLSALGGFFDDQPAASLLHGDLWSGNYAFTQEGLPVIFDPAVYFGDREADLAMTELFGGFPARFYDAYNDHYALDKGYPTRKTLYNLYHILNHFNLFGGGYLGQAEGMIDRLLAEVR